MGTREGHAKPIAERYKALPNFRLEKDDDGNADIKQTVAQYEFECRKILFDGEPVEKNDGGNTRRHRCCSSAAEEL
jgi:hypothetical protein